MNWVEWAMRSCLLAFGLILSVVPVWSQVFIITGTATVQGSSGDLAGQPTTADAVSFSFTVDTSTAVSGTGTGYAAYEGAISDLSLSIAGSSATFTGNGPTGINILNQFEAEPDTFYDGFVFSTEETDAAVYGMDYDNGAGGTGSAFLSVLVLAPVALYDSTAIPNPFTTLSDLTSVGGTGGMVLSFNTSGSVFITGDLLISMASNDYTVSAVPEPGSFAAMAGMLALGCTLVRRPTPRSGRLILTDDTQAEGALLGCVGEAYPFDCGFGDDGRGNCLAGPNLVVQRHGHRQFR